MLKQIITICFCLFAVTVNAQQQTDTLHSGNPLFKGWYADPEGAVFEKKFWIYPTYSAIYNQQVFFDAFSSSDLINWMKHERILDTAAIKWARRAMWAPSVIKKKKKYYFFFGANDIQSDKEYGGIGIAVDRRAPLKII
jgi:beta-xylosidase